MVATLSQLGQHNNRARFGAVAFLAAQTKSEAIDCTDARLLGVIAPADIFSATTLTFEASTSEAGTYRAVYGDDGTAVQVTVAASRAVALPIEKLAPWPWLKLVLNQEQTSGSSWTALAQGL